MKRIIKIITLAVLFYGTFAVSADRGILAVQDDESKVEKTIIDDALAKRYGTATVEAMIAHMQRDPKANYGAHVIPIAKVLFNGLPIRVLSVAATFEDGVSRMQVGRRITLPEAMDGMWTKAIFSKDAQMHVERPLLSFLEQPLAPENIIGARFMNKEIGRLVEEGEGYGHAMLFYEFPNAIDSKVLDEHKEFAQNQFALVKAFNDWLLSVNINNFKEPNPRGMHNPANLINPSRNLTAQQRKQGLDLIVNIEGFAHALNFTEPYMAFIGELKTVLNNPIDVNVQTIQVAHKQYCDRFGKFGLHASKRPTDKQVNAYLRLRGYADRVGSSWADRLELLGWKVKNGDEGKAGEVNTEALMNGQGAINFPAIAGLDWLFKHLYQLETQEILKGNRAFKAHKESSALLPVLIRTMGVNQVAHIALHTGNLGDVFQQWKTDAELRIKLKPATLLEERYAQELEKALLVQNIDETLPLGTPITPSRYHTQCLEALSSAILQERGADEHRVEDQAQMEKNIRIKSIRETLQMEPNLSKSQKLMKYIELGVINEHTPFGAAFVQLLEDSITLESSDTWFLAHEGHSFSSEGIDKLILKHGKFFPNPETHTVITRKDLSPNNIMASMITRAVTACTDSIEDGEPELSEEELVVVVNSVLQANCGYRLELFNKNPDFSKAITMREDLPAKGLRIGNTYPQVYVASKLWPRLPENEAVLELKTKHANTFYPNLRLNGFISEHRELLFSGPIHVARKVPQAQIRRVLVDPVKPQLGPNIPAWVADIEDDNIRREALLELGIQ